MRKKEETDAVPVFAHAVMGKRERDFRGWISS
jgi:hypothetical protein